MAIKKLILAANCSDPILNSGCNLCYLELRPEVIDLIIKYHRNFLSVHEVEDSLLSMYFRFDDSLYLAWNERLSELTLSDGLKLREQIGKGHVILPWNFNADNYDHGLSKDEQIVIYKDGFSFFAQTEDGFFVETEIVNMSVLK